MSNRSKRVHGFPLAPELVIELKERLSQTCSEAEWRNHVRLNRVPCRCEHAHLAFESRQQNRRIGKALVHRPVPPLSCQQVRHRPSVGVSSTFGQRLLQRSPQVGSGRCRRHQDQRLTSHPRIAHTEQIDKCALEGLEIRRAQQTGSTGCDQRSFNYVRSRQTSSGGPADTFRA